MKACHKGRQATWCSVCGLYVSLTRRSASITWCMVALWPADIGLLRYVSKSQPQLYNNMGVSLLGGIHRVTLKTAQHRLYMSIECVPWYHKRSNTLKHKWRLVQRTWSIKQTKNTCMVSVRFKDWRQKRISSHWKRAILQVPIRTQIILLYSCRDYVMQKHVFGSYFVNLYQNVFIRATKNSFAEHDPASGASCNFSNSITNKAHSTIPSISDTICFLVGLP